MPSINRSALVEYSASQMFDLVNDIEKYPEFMQGCTSARVLSKSKQELVGELCLTKHSPLPRGPCERVASGVFGAAARSTASPRYRGLAECGCRMR